MIDVSGSMDDSIAKVREQLGIFATSLADDNINANYAVITYETSADIHDFGGNMWTSDVNALSNDLASIITYGGTENIAFALQQVLAWEDSKWHSDKARIVFVLTDEYGDDDPTTLIDQLVDKNITVSVVAEISVSADIAEKIKELEATDPEYYEGYYAEYVENINKNRERYQKLSQETGGTLIDIQTDDWQEAMRKVATLTSNLAKIEIDERLPYSVISPVTSSDETTLNTIAAALDMSSGAINLVANSDISLYQDLTKTSKDSYGSNIDFISVIDTLTLSKDSLAENEYGYFLFKIDFAQTIIDSTDITSLTVGNYAPVSQDYGNGYLSFAMLDPDSNTKVTNLQKTANVMIYAKNGDKLSLYLVKDRRSNTLKLWSYNIAQAGITYSSIRDKTRAWMHGFTMTQELINGILAAFPGLSASEIFQFTDEEIIADDLTVGYNDSEDIGKNGDSVVINFPTVLPAHSGVYVIRYDLSDAPSGKKLKAQGISQPVSDAFFASDFDEYEFTASALQNMEYKFFDESYNPIDKLSDGSSKIVYAAVRMTSSEQTSGVIVVNTSLPQATVTPISDDENAESLLETIARVCSLDSDTLYLLKPEHIFDPVEPSQEDIDRIKREENYEIVGKLNTLSVDITGNYVFQVDLSETLYEILNNLDIGEIKIFTEDEITAEDLGIEVESSFITGVVNTAELLTLSGEKIEKITAKHFIMVLFLNAGNPLCFFFGKALLSILGGGCNVGGGVLALAVAGMTLRLIRRK